MKTIIHKNLLEKIGIDIPEPYMGLSVDLSQDGKVTDVSLINLPNTIGGYLNYEDSTRKLYGELLRIADFYRCMENGIEIRSYGLDFKNLANDSWRKNGKLCNPDFAFSYPETRDAFYFNFRDDLLKVLRFIKNQYK